MPPRRRGIGRRWLATVVGLAMAAGVSSCGGSAYVDYEPAAKPTGPRPDVAFRASITRQGDGLRIDYRLANTGSTPVVVFNGVLRRDDRSRSDVDAVYVTARRDGTVEVAKRTFSVPEGIEVAGLEFIWATIVPAGKAVGEGVAVPLPLKPYRPYQAFLDQPIKLPDPVKRAVFCVGAARLDSLPPQKQRSFASPLKHSPYETRMFPQNGRDHLFCSQPYDLPS